MFYLPESYLINRIGKNNKSDLVSRKAFGGIHSYINLSIDLCKCWFFSFPPLILESLRWITFGWLSTSIIRRGKGQLNPSSKWTCHSFCKQTLSVKIEQQIAEVWHKQFHSSNIYIYIYFQNDVSVLLLGSLVTAEVIDKEHFSKSLCEFPIFSIKSIKHTKKQSWHYTLKTKPAVWKIIFSAMICFCSLIMSSVAFYAAVYLLVRD